MLKFLYLTFKIKNIKVNKMPNNNGGYRKKLFFKSKSIKL